MDRPAALRSPVAGLACALAWTLAFAWAADSAAWGAPSAWAEASAPAGDVVGGTRTLYVARRRWHVDVGFATPDLIPPLAAATRGLSGVGYTFFGFGDRRYLTAKRRLPATLAALWRGEGLILVTGLRTPPADAFGRANVIRIRVSADAARRAQEFIRQSLRAGGQAGSPAAGALPGPYQDSLYLAAVPTYSAFHTCNTWVAEALASAGLPVRSRGVLFAGQLWHRARPLGVTGT